MKIFLETIQTRIFLFCFRFGYGLWVALILDIMCPSETKEFILSIWSYEYCVEEDKISFLTNHRHQRNEFCIICCPDKAM